MKTYFKILQYAPLQRFIAPFFVFSIFSSLFAILNFTLLGPLLDVLFNTEVSSENAIKSTKGFIGKFNNLLADYALKNGKVKTLWVVCGIIVSSVLLSNIFKYLSVRIIENVKGFTVLKLRKAVFDKAIHLDLSFFSEKRKGDIISRLTSDIQEVENSVGRAFSAIFREFFTLISYFITLFIFSWKLTLFSLLIIPLSAFFISLITKKLRENAKEVQQKQSNLISLFDEVFGGLRVIKGFGAEKYINNKFEKDNKSYFDAWLKMIFRQEAAPPVSEFLGVLMVAIILIFGGTMVLSGNSEMSASAFISYIILFSQVTRPAKEISNAISGTQRGIAAADRILKLIETEPTIKDIEQPIEIKAFEKEITFKNVDFSYIGSKKILNNINFTIQKGKTIALVGASGGGKSTIADLLARFYDPSQGDIFIDGVNLKAASQSSLRSLLGIVTQESILFNDTIYNNILFGNEATEQQVFEAARIANAHEFIIQSPNGYQTMIGDKGGKLSGGQRQRISIARAVLKNPSILILDEATSALDTESEKLVQDALAKLMKNRTAIVIAHRLSTIQNADEIIVIHNGEIVEKGSHNGLMSLENGYYKKLNNLDKS